MDCAKTGTSLGPPHAKVGKKLIKGEVVGPVKSTQIVSSMRWNRMVLEAGNLARFWILKPEES